MEQRSRVLVVDDQPIGQVVLTNLLESEGYDIAFATSGREALQQMQLVAPDLVLLDVMMPEMDGFEVCQRIRANPALALIPVILVTALNDQASLMRGIEAGADDFISKPFNRTELRARIRTITRLNRFRLLVDEQRRAESERAQLLWTIERASDGFLLLDEADHVQGGNPQAWRYIGLLHAPECIPTCTFTDLIQPHFRCEPSAAWRNWPHYTPSDRYLVRPEGAEPALWLRVELFDLPSHNTGTRLVRLHDVTARILAQRQVWTFHSFLSHKLRTPLTSMLMGAGILARQKSNLSPDLLMLVETTYAATQRLKSVVDGVFRYLEAPMILTHGPGITCAELPALITPIATDRGVTELTVQIDPVLTEIHLGLNTQTMELVIGELLENARKFHPERRPTVQISITPRDNHVQITITDDGLTLTAAQLAQIREPYQQIDQEFTGQVPGVGLGIPTVARICWSAGGTFQISNRADGPGIMVELVLPQAHAVEDLTDAHTYHDTDR